MKKKGEFYSVFFLERYLPPPVAGKPFFRSFSRFFAGKSIGKAREGKERIRCVYKFNILQENGAESFDKAGFPWYDNSC